jgi:hypothetical protein
VGPQARWHQHMFGPRNYPLVHLDFDLAVSKVAEHDEIILKCHYGDPVCWPDLLAFAQHFKEKVIIHTYAQCDTDLITSLKELGCRFCFELDGAGQHAGKMYLGTDWSKTHRNIVAAGYSLLQCDMISTHSFSDSKQILDDINVAVHKQDYLNPREPTPIVDQNGVWLHDVYPENYQYEMPQRSLLSYNMLRTMINPPCGRSILENPKLPKISPVFRTNTVEDVYVCPTGHVFDSEKAAYFMYMLADDWDCLSDQTPDDVLMYAQIFKQEL